MHFKYSLIALVIASLYCNMFFDALLVIFCLVFHEFGHIILCLIFKQKIKRVNLSIFGGEVVVINSNLSFIKELLIDVMGIVMNIILLFVLNLFFKENKYYMFMFNYNILMIVFNLLPIYPLDGYRIIELIFSRLSFSSHFSIVTNISVVFLIMLLIIIIYLESIFLFFLFCLLVFKNINRIKNKDKIILINLVNNML